MNISSLTSQNDDPFAPDPFTERITLSSGLCRHQTEALIDTGASGFAFIDEIYAQSLSDQFGIDPFPLSKPKPIRAYDGIHRQPITHKLPLTLTVRGKTTVSAPS